MSERTQKWIVFVIISLVMAGFLLGDLAYLALVWLFWAMGAPLEDVLMFGIPGCVLGILIVGCYLMVLIGAINTVLKDYNA